MLTCPHCHQPVPELSSQQSAIFDMLRAALYPVAKDDIYWHLYPDGDSPPECSDTIAVQINPINKKIRPVLRKEIRALKPRSPHPQYVLVEL